MGRQLQLNVLVTIMSSMAGNLCEAVVCKDLKEENLLLEEFSFALRMQSA